MTNTEFFKNSMRPDWVLSGDWRNDKKTIKRLRKALRKFYSSKARVLIIT